MVAICILNSKECKRYHEGEMLCRTSFMKEQDVVFGPVKTYAKTTILC